MVPNYVIKILENMLKTVFSPGPSLVVGLMAIALIIKYFIFFLTIRESCNFRKNQTICILYGTI